MEEIVVDPPQDPPLLSKLFLKGSTQDSRGLMKISCLLSTTCSPN